mmetsp:Transcript_4080/g.9544  ORF Transcript_4080/g.9544 Transcript_4080/m.9544 type:complete len:287 (+) Transcript_4080:567-1427(+)
MLEQDVAQPDLGRILFSSLLLQRRCVGCLHSIKEHNDGAQAKVTNLAQPLHGSVDKGTRRHARSACTALEDSGDCNTPADGIVERPTDEGKAVVFVLQLQDLDLWSCQHLRNTVWPLEIQIPEGARPPYRWWHSAKRNFGFVSRTLLVIIVVLLVVWVFDSMCFHEFYCLTAAHAEDAPNITKRCYDQTPTSNERNCGTATVACGWVLLCKLSVEFLEALPHGNLQALVLPVAAEGCELRKELLMKVLHAELGTDIAHGGRRGTPAVALVQRVERAWPVKMLDGKP